MSKIRTVSLLLLCAALVACATPGADESGAFANNNLGVALPVTTSGASNSASSDAAEPRLNEAAPNPRAALPNERRVVPTGIRTARKVDMYLRVQPDATGLINAIDDGRFTYIVFRNRTPDGVGIFDPDGKAISFVKSGSVVAFSGLHQGILVRTAFGYSFVAPNPRATPADRPDFDDDPEVAEARSRLEGELSQMEAMRKAISRVERRSIDGTIDNAGAASSGGADGSSSGARRGGGDEQPSVERRPNGETLIRIYFPDGRTPQSKTDEGMLKLAKEARGASEAVVVAYPDPAQGKTSGASMASARADMVKSTLLRNGIPANRISINASPATLPISENSAAGRQSKRRVEVLLRGKKS